MSTTEVESGFDYFEYARGHDPDPDLIRRGTEERRRRRERAKQRITIRIDEDILEEFRALVPQGRGYQSLINQALREWLVAQSVKDLIRQELSETVRQSLSLIAAGGQKTGTG